MHSTKSMGRLHQEEKFPYSPAEPPTFRFFVSEEPFSVESLEPRWAFLALRYFPTPPLPAAPDSAFPAPGLLNHVPTLSWSLKSLLLE